MFRYWTEDDFAAPFRRMLTIGQYRGDENNVAENRTDGYEADGNKTNGYEADDNKAPDVTAYEMLESHPSRWQERWNC